MERVESSTNGKRCPKCESPVTIFVSEYDDEDDQIDHRYLGTYKECLVCWHMWDIERPGEETVA